MPFLSSLSRLSGSLLVKFGKKEETWKKDGFFSPSLLKIAFLWTGVAGYRVRALKYTFGASVCISLQEERGDSRKNFISGILLFPPPLQSIKLALPPPLFRSPAASEGWRKSTWKKERNSGFVYTK